MNHSATENRLYNKRAQRDDVNVTDIILRILRANESVEAIRSPEDLSRYINARLMQPQDELRTYQMRFLDMNRLARYQPDIGFKLSVDFASALSKEELSVCITSLVPPGAYYAEPRMTDDVHFTHNFEPTSLIKFPRWTAGASLWVLMVYHCGNVTTKSHIFFIQGLPDMI